MFNLFGLIIVKSNRNEQLNKLLNAKTLAYNTKKLTGLSTGIPILLKGLSREMSRLMHGTPAWSGETYPFLKSDCITICF